MYNNYIKRMCNPCFDHNLIQNTKLLAPDKIIMEVCDFFSVPVGRVIGDSRSGELVNARHFICDILYSDAFLKLSLKQIGRLLGNRDHSTVLHSIKCVRNQCEVNEFYRENYRKLHLFIYSTDRYFRYTEQYFKLQKELKIPRSKEFIKN